MSPALTKAMGGAQAKGAIPKKPMGIAPGHMQIKPQQRGLQQNQSQAQDIHVDQVP